MSSIHKLKIIPGSESELRFMDILKSVGVKHEAVICRVGLIFGTPYNEYIISDGLYKLIRTQLIGDESLSQIG